MTVSIGISQFPRDADDAGDLLRNADAAMFRAKSAGAGRLGVPRARGRRRARAPVAVDAAAPGRGGPGVAAPLPAARRPARRLDVRGRGADPLARPRRRPGAARRVHPARRGDGADRRDRRVGRRGDRTPGRGLARRRARPRDRLQPLAAPAPPRRPRDDGSPQAITSAGVDPERITVEITESTAMDDPDRIIELLCRFKDLGVQLAIDDFGTGYSSLVAAAVHAGRRPEDRPDVHPRGGPRPTRARAWSRRSSRSRTTSGW